MCPYITNNHFHAMTNYQCVKLLLMRSSIVKHRFCSPKWYWRNGCGSTYQEIKWKSITTQRVILSTVYLQTSDNRTATFKYQEQYSCQNRVYTTLRMYDLLPYSPTRMYDPLPIWTSIQYRIPKICWYAWKVTRFFYQLPLPPSDREKPLSMQRVP